MRSRGYTRSSADSDHNFAYLVLEFIADLLWHILIQEALDGHVCAQPGALVHLCGVSEKISAMEMRT